MNRVEAQPSITPDARVLMRATPPLQTESSKKRWLILAGGSVIGLLLGGAIVLARNFPFGVFRTSQQVTHATGLPCAVLPEIESADEQASLRTGEYVLDWPYSRFSQTLRSIWATINIAQRESGAKVVCVISSNPGEGKTTVAINLAAHFGRALDHARASHRCRLPSPVADEESGSRCTRRAQRGLGGANGSRQICRQERAPESGRSPLSRFPIGCPTRRSCLEQWRWSSSSRLRAKPMTW